MASFLLGSRAGATTPLKVLIVDTDWEIVRELSAATRALGGEPLEATTYEAARQLWMAERPPFLVADIRLGPFNGLQLLLRAKDDRPDVVAAITSSVADGVLEADTQRFGATFLVKPLEAGQVLKALLGERGEVKLERFESRQTGERRRDVPTDLMHERPADARPPERD
jgi:ActR/RegA family two-component response regulator